MAKCEDAKRRSCEQCRYAGRQVNQDPEGQLLSSEHQCKSRNLHYGNKGLNKASLLILRHAVHVTPDSRQCPGIAVSPPTRPPQSRSGRCCSVHLSTVFHVRPDQHVSSVYRNNQSETFSECPASVCCSSQTATGTPNSPPKIRTTLSFHSMFFRKAQGLSPAGLHCMPS